MGWFSLGKCVLGWHQWDQYRDPPKHYVLFYCPSCGKVSSSLNGKPTVARKPTFSEVIFLKDNFSLTGPWRRY